MGDCTSKQAIVRQQNNNNTQQSPQQTQKPKSITETTNTQKTQQSTAKYDQKIITRRQDQINQDENKVPSLKHKLELIRSGKYEQAGIKASNAYFEMIRIQKQIELYQQKISKSKARQTVHA